MNVKELKERLEGIPEDLEVVTEYLTGTDIHPKFCIRVEDIAIKPTKDAIPIMVPNLEGEECLILMYHEKEDAEIKETEINNTIDILGIKFTVIQAPVVNKQEARKGEIDFLTNEIRIDESMPKDLKYQTLTHEILHAILDLLGMYELGENENAVQSLATAIHYVFKMPPISF